MLTPIEKFYNYEMEFNTFELKTFEGASIIEQTIYFIDLLTKNPQIKIILEIGFNTGRSAAHFLSSRDDIQVISVDIGAHPYINDCKKLIDKHFPNRHSLLIGDSKVVLPKLLDFQPKINFDLIFIDGDHSEPGPLIDARNCLALANKDTHLVMDDTCFLTGSEGVLQAMCELINKKEIDLLRMRTITADQRAWTLFFQAS
jgi:predicted O-methyltransferase YrrM